MGGPVSLTNGRVTAHFEDGSSAEADVLVAADGASSRIRRQYLPEAKMEDTLMQEGTAKFAEPQHALLKLIAEKRASVR